MFLIVLKWKDSYPLQGRVVEDGWLDGWMKDVPGMITSSDYI